MKEPLKKGLPTLSQIWLTFVIKRGDAKEALEKAIIEGDEKEIDKQNKRLVRVTEKHVEDCKKLLIFMGIPYVQGIFDYY